MFLLGSTGMQCPAIAHSLEMYHHLINTEPQWVQDTFPHRPEMKLPFLNSSTILPVVKTNKTNKEKKKHLLFHLSLNSAFSLKYFQSLIFLSSTSTLCPPSSPLLIIILYLCFINSIFNIKNKSILNLRSQIIHDLMIPSSCLNHQLFSIFFNWHGDYYMPATALNTFSTSTHSVLIAPLWGSTTVPILLIGKQHRKVVALPRSYNY